MCVLYITVDDCGGVGWPLVDLIEEEHSLTFSMSWSGLMLEPEILSGIVFSDWCFGSVEIFVVVDDNCVGSVFVLFSWYDWRPLSLSWRDIIGCFRFVKEEDEGDSCSFVFSFLWGGWGLLLLLLDSTLVRSIIIIVILSWDYDITIKCFACNYTTDHFRDE